MLHVRGLAGPPPSPPDRHQGIKGFTPHMVIWVTGLSGAGKTTVCRAMEAILKPATPEIVLVDGDAVREIFGAGLGYSEADRFVQIKRVQSLAHVLEAQGLVVLVAALFSHPTLLTWNRQTFSRYFEVYLEAPDWLVRKRDDKGLYAGADAGTREHVVGVDIPRYPPENPDLVLDAAAEASPDQLAWQVIRAAPELESRV